MVNSRDKGCRGEREWAGVCREQGYSECRRGQQFSGIEGDDCVGLPFLHQEIKRVEKLQLEKAMDQSIRDAKPGEIPIVAHRKNRGKWLVTMKAEDWFTFYREFHSDQMLRQIDNGVGVENGGSS